MSNVINCKNGIIGMAIGDAMGIQNEGVPRVELINNPRVEMAGCKKYDLPKGTWTGNSSLALATMGAIIEKDSVDTEAIAKNYFRWFKHGEYSCYPKAYDVRNTILKSMARYEVNLNGAEECGSSLDTDIDNSVLSRMVPLAYYCYYKNFDRDKIYKITKKTSSITHKQEISIMSAFIFVLYINELLNKRTKEEAYNYIKNVDYSNYFSNDTIEEFHYILNGHIATYDLARINSSGNVIDTLEAVLWVFFNTYSYNGAVIGAINIGGDTSTMGALVGALAGIYYSLDKINMSWEKDLMRYNNIKNLCEEYTSACVD